MGVCLMSIFFYIYYILLLLLLLKFCEMFFFFFFQIILFVLKIHGWNEGRQERLKILSLVSKKQKQFYPLLPYRGKHTLKFSYTIFDESYLSPYGTVS